MGTGWVGVWEQRGREQCVGRGARETAERGSEGKVCVCARARGAGVRVCVRVYLCACVCVRVRMRVGMRVRMRVHVRVHVCVCMGGDEGYTREVRYTRIQKVCRARAFARCSLCHFSRS